MAWRETEWCVGYTGIGVESIENDRILEFPKLAPTDVATTRKAGQTIKELMTAFARGGHGYDGVEDVENVRGAPARMSTEAGLRTSLTMSKGELTLLDVMRQRISPLDGRVFAGSAVRRLSPARR